ncbi:MAG: hypothetical protein P8171_05280 [Candidatus Thiodiazotropha sp.]
MPASHRSYFQNFQILIVEFPKNERKKIHIAIEKYDYFGTPNYGCLGRKWGSENAEWIRYKPGHLQHKGDVGILLAGGGLSKHPKDTCIMRKNSDMGSKKKI